MLVPPVGVLWVAGTLDPDDTKALTSWCLHDHPPLKTLYHCGSKLLQTCHLRRDVVRLNVEVHATLVLYTLDLNDRFVRRGFEHAIVVSRTGVLAIDWSAKRRGPEGRSLIHIDSVAVDQNSTESRVVRHCLSQFAMLSLVPPNARIKPSREAASA